MQIRDISVRKRLLFANFMMVFVPVCLLMLVGSLLFAGLRFTGTARQSALAMLWPEKGPAQSIQFAVSSLRVRAEKKGNLKVHDIQEDCRILEDQGIDTMVTRNGESLYATPGADAAVLQDMVQQRCGSSQSMMVWDDAGFAFRYVSPRSGTTVLAAGSTPFLAKGGSTESMVRDILEAALFVVLGLAIITIIFMGVYLSRLLSRQIIEPLTVLNQAAAEIRRGNLDVHLDIQTQDELGDTCRNFDRMRCELKNARETQQKYEQNRKELIAGISHDLSTPLTSLKGYASGILDGIARTPEKRRHYVEMIHSTACSMEKLVDSLFLFSKLDLGRVPFHLETVDLAAYFADYTAENQAAYAQRGLQLEFSGTGCRALVQIDRMQFQRVVENLLENSLKYNQVHGVRVRISLTVQEKMVQLSFADDGIGVAAEELPRLFESFYRTDPARTNVAKGSGLGLAIVKQIIVGLRGDIRAEASPDGGLAICIKLPAAVKGGEKE